MIIFYLALVWTFVLGHFGFYKIAAIGVLVCILSPIIFAFLGNSKSNNDDKGRDIGE